MLANPSGLTYSLRFDKIKYMGAIVGLDEVGRGCWAGPLVAGAVILGKPIKGLRDSKKLTKKQREELAEIINNEALSVGLGWVEPMDIDRLGLTESIGLAMNAALSQIKVPYKRIIIDGNHAFVEDERVEARIGADDSVPCVSAASIIAKVARDNYMAKMSVKFPGYGFEKHVGYGTKLHSESLKVQGVCKLHRLSYKPVKLAMQ